MKYICVVCQTPFEKTSARRLTKPRCSAACKRSVRADSQRAYSARVTDPKPSCEFPEDPQPYCRCNGCLLFAEGLVREDGPEYPWSLFPQRTFNVSRQREVIQAEPESPVHRRTRESSESVSELFDEGVSGVTISNGTPLPDGRDIAQRRSTPKGFPVGELPVSGAEVGWTGHDASERVTRVLGSYEPVKAEPREHKPIGRGADTPLWVDRGEADDLYRWALSA